MSYVNDGVEGWTELRVHGVSGTPPEAMLRHPHVQLIAGNSQAGFYRRVWAAKSISADTQGRRLEAYSWGGLTSGDNRRALWLLLLPFMLLNVAFYMAPSRRPPDSGRGKRTEWFSASVQRLFALSFTVMFALTVVSVSMDLVGWQCGEGPASGRPQRCAGGAGWLSWLGWSWLDSPGRQLAATALVPLAAFFVLWRIARNTWQNLERTDVPPGAPKPKVLTPLEDRAMWNGRQAVRRLRALHVAAGLAVPGVFLAAALLPDPSRGLAAIGNGDAWDSPAAVIRALALIALLGLLLGVAVTTAWPDIASRKRPNAEASLRDREQEERRSPFRFLPWVALVLTVVAGAAAWPFPTEERVSTGGLPWLIGSVLGLFAVQFVLLLLLVIACSLLRRFAPPRPKPGPRQPVSEPAWRGFGMPGVAVLGWLLAGGLSAGVVLRAADTLGRPVVDGRTEGDDALVVPTAYHWVAVLGLVAGLAVVVLAGRAYSRLRKPSGDDLRLVDAAYPGVGRTEDGYAQRREEIARQWRRAQDLAGQARRGSGYFLLVMVAFVAVAITLYLTVGPRLLTDAPLLVTIAGLALTAFVLALLWVGRQAYRNQAFRRTVGIAWDIGTFWPRAVHPLAPPCYAERAIPDLMGRLKLFADHQDGRRVLLSCHSQGAVLGAVTLMQVEQATSTNTCYLTYGSPLTRLYQRFFPAYFSPQALDRLGGFLVAAPAPAPDAQNPRANWRWRNLYRRSDPIGGAIFVEYDAVLERKQDHQAEGDNADVDRQLIDPPFTREAGNPCYPPTCGHSNYFSDPAFDWTVNALHDRLLPAHADQKAAVRGQGPTAPTGAP